MKHWANSNWRAAAGPIIAKVIQENPGKDERELRRLISAKYPFGPRKYHPYKIWLDEVSRQLNGGAPPPVVDDRKLVFGDASRPYGRTA